MGLTDLGLQRVVDFHLPINAAPGLVNFGGPYGDVQCTEIRGHLVSPQLNDWFVKWILGSKVVPGDAYDDATRV